MDLAVILFDIIRLLVRYINRVIKQWYTTKWKTPAIDVSAYAGQVVTLVFAVSDVGDSAFDTAVLIDNVHFSFG